MTWTPRAAASVTLAANAPRASPALAAASQTSSNSCSVSENCTTLVRGTAWRDRKELDAYLHQLEEAERRDHRRIGKEMGLFHIQEEAAGSVFWHPKGWRLYRTLETYLRRRLDAWSAAPSSWCWRG